MDIGKLVNQAKVKTYQGGEVIFNEGDDSHEGLGFVLSGQVGVYKMVDGQEIFLNPVPQASFFGEIALMLGTPRQATARADTDAKIIFLNKSVFMDEASNNFAFLKGLISTAYTRIDNLQKETDRYRQAYTLKVPAELEAVRETNRSLNRSFVEYLQNYRSIVVTTDRPLYDEGDLNTEHIYLVLEGELTAARKFGKQVLKIQTFTPGDFFGVMESFDKTSRPFSVVAQNDQTRVAVVDEDLLYRVLRLNLPLFFSFFRSVLLELIVWQEAFLEVKGRAGF